MRVLHFSTNRKFYTKKICSFTLYLCCCNSLSCVHIVHRGETLVIIILAAVVVVDVVKYKKSLPSVPVLLKNFFVTLVAAIMPMR